jgi:hypothetical protein
MTEIRGCTSRTKFRGTMPGRDRPTNATAKQFADAWIEAAAGSWRDSEHSGGYYWHHQTDAIQAIGAAEIARFWQERGEAL